MSTNATLTDNTTTTNPQANAKCAYFGYSNATTPDVPYDISPNSPASEVIAYGPLTEGASAALRASGSDQVAVPVTSSIAGTISAVVCTPSGGPAITATGTPVDNLNLRLKITKAGELGESRFQWATNGSTYQGEDYTPIETPAEITGTVDVSAGAVLDTTTLIFVDPAAAVLTFSGSFADADAIATQFNTLAASAALTPGSLTSELGSFPVALVAGDDFIGKVDEQGSADTLVIEATPATITGNAATYAAVTPGHTLTLSLLGTPYVITFTGSENDQASFLLTINGQISAAGFAEDDGGGNLRFSTFRKGSSATGAVVAGSFDVLASFGILVDSFVNAGPNNVANEDLVTAAEFAGLLTSTFIGGTAGSTGTAIGTDQVKWATNTPGASPKGVQFTAGAGVAKIMGFDTSEHNGSTGASLPVRARVVQGKYIQTYTLATGDSAALAIDSSSTADTVLGLSNTPVTGNDATFTPPNTGVDFTWPTGTYRLDDVYAADITAPRFGTAALLTAMDGLFNDKTKVWDDIIILQPPVDGAETLAFMDAISTKLSTWRGEEPRKAVFVMLASSIGATGKTGITTNDTDVKNACQNFTDPWILLCHGDGYASGTEFPGKTRRPLVHGVGAIACSRRYSADLGSRDAADATIPEFDLLSPDGLVAARSEYTATVKMYARQSSGQRFTVAKLDSGSVYVVKGVTRAVTSSKFRHSGKMRLGRAALNLAFLRAKRYENTDPLLRQNGTLLESYAASHERADEKVFHSELVDAGHASAVKIRLDRTEVVSQTDNVTINGEVQIRGEAETVKFNVGVVGEISIS